jgi:hypothetical protein
MTSTGENIMGYIWNHCIEPGFLNNVDKNYQSHCLVTEPNNLWNTTILCQLMTKLPATLGRNFLWTAWCANTLAVEPDTFKVQVLA